MSAWALTPVPAVAGVPVGWPVRKILPTSPCVRSRWPSLPEAMAVGLPLPVNNLALTVASFLQLGAHARATYVRRQSSISRRETDLNGALISRCSGTSAGQRTPIGPLGAFYGGAASDCLSKAPLKGEELN